MENSWFEYSIKYSLVSTNIASQLLFLKSIKPEDFIMACQKGLRFSSELNNI